jgi:hypothetical protein
MAAPPPHDPLAPDPDLYDDPRNVRARAKGLPAPYIAGGEDPDPAKGLADDRKYGRWLIYMVVGLILVGFVVGIAIALAVRV